MSDNITLGASYFALNPELKKIKSKKGKGLM